jgi:hypothetical protein
MTTSCQVHAVVSSAMGETVHFSELAQALDTAALTRQMTVRCQGSDTGLDNRPAFIETVRCQGSDTGLDNRPAFIETKTSTLAGARAPCATSDPAAVVARDQDDGTVASKTALLSAAVRRPVIFWYSGLATIWLNARRLG